MKVKDLNAASLLANLSGSFDHAPWAVTEVAGEAHIVRYANSTFCQLIDKPRDEVIGKPFDALLPPSDACLALLERVYRTGTATSYIAEEQSTPGTLLFSYNLWPVMHAGQPAGVMIQVNETASIHETRKAISQALLLGALHQDELIEAADSANLKLRTEINERIRREEEAKLLTSEVAHRVKNNLQIVAALLANEIKRTPPPWMEGYKATQERIIAIARLYDLMSLSSLDRSVEMEAYLAASAAALSTSIAGDRPGIRIVVEAEALTIESERAVPFGLLVNELCTNAVKHAFPDGVGQVTLGLRCIDDEIELRVADDGIGAWEKSSEDKPGKHGSDYVAIFVRQLNGQLTRSATPGAGMTVIVRFPQKADIDV